VVNDPTYEFFVCVLIFGQLKRRDGKKQEHRAPYSKTKAAVKDPKKSSATLRDSNELHSTTRKAGTASQQIFFKRGFDLVAS
jgi:hypothetical protein